MTKMIQKEKILQNLVYKHLKQFMDDVDIEVPADQDLHILNPLKRRRIDLFFSTPDSNFINPIAIELKIANNSSGALVAKTYRQIKKYSSLSFKGQKIGTWVVGFLDYRLTPLLFSKGINNVLRQDALRYILFSEDFFNNMGIGFINFNQSTNIKFCQSKSNSLRILQRKIYEDYFEEIEKETRKKEDSNVRSFSLSEFA